MVQVDIFWSYGLASGLTLAAGKGLEKTDEVWGNRYVFGILLWLAVLFAPSGMYLLWRFPAWETMQVATSHESIPAWLVCLFAITNITQGMLGYFVTRRCWVTGKKKLAVFQTIWSHVAMFFILFVGWDGTGFLRFTHTGLAEDYHAGNLRPWWEFFSSEVAFTLIGMGVVLIPTYVLLCRKFRD